MLFYAFLERIPPKQFLPFCTVRLFKLDSIYLCKFNTILLVNNCHYLMNENSSQMDFWCFFTV